MDGRWESHVWESQRRKQEAGHRAQQDKVRYFDARLTNCGPWVKTGLLSVFINKVLLEHSHAHLYFFGFFHIMITYPQNWKYLLSVPLQSFPTLLSGPTLGCSPLLWLFPTVSCSCMFPSHYPHSYPCQVRPCSTDSNLLSLAWSAFALWNLEMCLCM